MDVFLTLLVFVSALFCLGVYIWDYLVKKRRNLISLLGFTGFLILSSTQMLRQFANLPIELTIPLNFVGITLGLAGIVIYFRGITIASRR
jgi:hypothetical protein